MASPDKLSPDESLHKAIQGGSLSDVRELVKDGVNLNHCSGMKGTPLCAAIEAKNVKIAKFLIEAGCDVNAPDYDGEPPLLLALRKEKPRTITLRTECLDIASLLIHHPKCDVNVTDSLTRKSPIHFATEQGMIEVVRWLVSNLICDVNKADINGNTPLHSAILDGNKDAVTELVSCSRCILNVHNNAGMVPLHVAANNGDVQSMEIILNSLKLIDLEKEKVFLQMKLEELDLQVSDLNGGECATFESCVNLKINPLTTYETETCLHLACRNEHKQIVEILLNAGSPVDLKNSFGQTPLLIACGTTHAWVNKDNSIPLMLLKAGASPNVKAPMRCRYVDRDLEVTCLILSCMSGNVELANTLVKHGADLEITDNQGRLPLFVAMWKHSVSVSQFLLKECIKLNIDLTVEDLSGQTLLHAAIKFLKNVSTEEKHEIIHLLVQNGAPLAKSLDVCIESEDDVALDAILSGSDINPSDIIYEIDTEYTVLHRAAAIGSLPLVRVLLCHGDNIDTVSPEGYTPLFCALENRHHNVAMFLVNNGCDLSLERYLFEMFTAPVCPGVKTKKEEESDRSSDESDDESDEIYISDEDDLPSGLVEDKHLARWLQSVAMAPKSLFLSCLVTVQRHFFKHRLRLSLVDSLSIPEEFKLKLRYKT